MSGHAILDSCHHCGVADVELFVTYVSPNSSSCGEDYGPIPDTKRHHIHVFAACGPCKASIHKESP